MKQETKKLKGSGVVERRSFLKGAAVTTAAVSGGALASNAIADTEVSDVASNSGYQESDHVKAYYKLARF